MPIRIELQWKEIARLLTAHINNSLHS
jgi:hypothetical protein